MYNKLYLVSTLLMVTNVVSFQESSTLKLVQVIFRNGISIPERTYPNDPFKDSSAWSEGRGQLSQKGQKYQRELGNFIAARYEHAFQKKDVETKTSNVQKTISSAEHFLYGLFDSNITNEFDIQILPSNKDNLISYSQPCLKFERMEKDVISSIPIRNTFKDHKRILDYISLHSGMDISNRDTFLNIYSTLYAQKYCDKILPEWADIILDSGAFDHLLSLMLVIPTYTPEMKRLRMGPLITNILNNIEEILKNPTNDTKTIRVFSGDAKTLIGLLHSLGMFDGAVPEFSSSILIELHQEPDSNQFHVEIHSNKNSGKLMELNQLWIPKCGLPCPLEIFSEILQQYLIYNFEEECNVSLFPWKAAISALFLLAAFPILIVVFVKFLEGRNDESTPLLLNSQQYAQPKANLTLC